ncbi:MAG: MOSC domain-containing protein [Rhodobacteraceae bacterium]|nr:MOSC domain-containing protein [Paracoccaceae bacterium]
MTASVGSIQRHPLKSHGRESLTSAELATDRSILWDRHWAVAHEMARLNEGSWSPCQNFSRGSKAPKLMAIDAALDEATGTLTLTHPEAGKIVFRPDDADDARRFIDWVRPISPSDRALPERIYSVTGRGMTDTDYPSVSLISLASNRALGEHLGLPISPLRWRGNFWLDGLQPFEEKKWIGRSVRLGEAVVEIVEPTVRCLATTANPETGERDTDTLGALKSLNGDQDFGVYARVITAGTVAVGDRVELLP